MSEKRKDNKGRILRTGEGQRQDGRYYFRWTTSDGKRRTEYANTLNELRNKEKEVERRRLLEKMRRMTLFQPVLKTLVQSKKLKSRQIKLL